jgi:hypothetical protein
MYSLLLKSTFQALDLAIFHDIDLDEFCKHQLTAEQHLI